MNDKITPSQFHQSEGAQDWRVIGDGANAFFASGSLSICARFVQAISELQGVDDHPPDIDVRADGVTVRLITLTKEYMGMTTRDLDLARQISGAARTLGLKADPSVVQDLLVIPGAPDITKVMPFWQAVLGYVRRPDSPAEDLVDPHNRGPAFWFERMDEPRSGGGGSIHLAVWVPPERAQARLEAALAAGGRMVRDQFAPSFWTLADAAGNEADIATVLQRQ
jgi:4a-hydroxytetrahydrobiopterin dehydratase